VSGFLPGDRVCVEGWADTVFEVVHGPVANRLADKALHWYLVASDAGHLLVEASTMWREASAGPSIGHGTSMFRDGMLYVKLDKTWWFAHSWLKAPVQDDEHYR